MTKSALTPFPPVSSILRQERSYAEGFQYQMKEWAEEREFFAGEAISAQRGLPGSVPAGAVYPEVMHGASVQIGAEQELVISVGVLPEGGKDCSVVVVGKD